MPRVTTSGEIFVNVTTKLVTSAEGDDSIPNSYISDDERMTKFLEFQVANWIDNIYVPICSGQLLTF